MELIESRVYTREQAADVLQVSIASIDRYIREGRLPVKRVSYVISGWIGEHRGRVIPATTLARQLVSTERRY